MSKKSSLTPSGIEPATFRFVTQHLNHYATILLYYHIGLVFLVRCVLVFQCGWFGVVSVLQAEAQASACNTGTTPKQQYRNTKTHRTKNTRPMW